MTQLADVQLDLDKWKLMHLGEARDPSDMQSNPFGSHSSANDMFMPHRGNSLTSHPQNVNSGPVSDEFLEESSNLDDQLKDGPSRQKTEKSLLNRAESLNLMFQGAPPSDLKERKELMNEDSEAEKELQLDEVGGDEGHGVGNIVNQLDQVLHVEKEKQLINNFMADANEQTAGQNREEPT